MSAEKKPNKPQDEFNQLLQEIFTDPDVEKVVGKVAGRIFARAGAAFLAPQDRGTMAGSAPPPRPSSEALEIERAYRTLGLTPEAPEEVVEAVYKALAKKFHPDAGNGDEKRMKEINAAHDLIVQSRKA